MQKKAHVTVWTHLLPLAGRGNTGHFAQDFLEIKYHYLRTYVQDVHFYYSNLLYEMGQDFLDIQYVYQVPPIHTVIIPADSANRLAGPLLLPVIVLTFV